MAEKRIHAIVTGRVQGVGFRFFTQRAAAKSGVKGWVRNRGDGSVEIEAQAGETVLERFLSDIHAGPPLARVHDMRTTPQSLRSDDSFNITG